MEYSTFRAALASLTMAAPLAACAALAALYVGVLYVPPLLLGRRGASDHRLLLQRFVCAGCASLLSLLWSARLLPLDAASSFARIFGLRHDHLVQAAFLPLILTGVLYLGPLFLAGWDAMDDEEDADNDHERVSALKAAATFVLSVGEDVIAWRNYVVAPLCEEIVFRACMVPLLTCGGYSPYAAVFICPPFFSIAHFHKFWELVHYEKYSKRKALLVVGSQLGYTVVFGWYAAFLFVRTGHLLAAVVPHVICNIMGFPDLKRVSKSKVLTLVHGIGLLCFAGLLGPLSSPRLYNNTKDISAGFQCKCWQPFCLVC